MTDIEKLRICFSEINVKFTEYQEDEHTFIEVQCKNCWSNPEFEFDINGKFIESHSGCDS